MELLQIEASDVSDVLLLVIVGILKLEVRFELPVIDKNISIFRLVSTRASKGKSI